MSLLDCPDVQIECDLNSDPELIENTTMHLRLRDGWCDFSVWNENIKQPQDWDSGWMHADRLNFTLSKASFAALQNLDIPALGKDAIQSSVEITGPFQVKVKDNGYSIDVSIQPFRFTAFIFDGRPVPDHGGCSEGDWENELGWKVEFLTERIYLDAIREATVEDVKS